MLVIAATVKCSTEMTKNTKAGAHVRHIAVRWRVQFQIANSSLATFNFIQILKNAYDLSDIVVLSFLLTKIQEKSQGRLWYYIALLFRYINNQIWGAANKNRINIISILINLQATGQERQSKQSKGKSAYARLTSSSLPSGSPLCPASTMPAPLQGDNSVF